MGIFVYSCSHKATVSFIGFEFQILLLFLYCNMFPTADSFINIHCHAKPKIPGEFVIRNAYLPVQQDKLNNLPYATSVGLHPWFIQQMSVNECSDRLIEAATSPKVLAIGEIGIDRAIHIPVPTQLTYFDAQVNIARALQKPVIIHAVRSYSDIIPFLKKSKVPFIFHQFSGNGQQANELIKYNAYLSFGQNLLDPKSAETFRNMPISQLFLETDISTRMDISDVYAKASELKMLPIDELKSIVFHNFARILKP
jgi:TatD DNase family protein